MSELSFAAWTATLTTDRNVTQTGGVLDWETEIVRDPVYTLTNSSTRAKVAEAGRYFVRYDAGLRDDPDLIALTVRSSILSNLRVNDADQVWGRALGYWRAQQGCNQTHLSAAAILELSVDDEVSVFAKRIDTGSANAGATARRTTFDGQFSLVRLKDSWRTIRAKATADQSASSTSGQRIVFDTTELADSGWSSQGGGDHFEFDPSAAGSAYDALSHVFLVCVTVEADITSGSNEGQLELQVRFSDGTGIEPIRKPMGYSTSYAEGVNGCTKVVCGWAGLVEGINGEASLHPESLDINYLHRNTNGTSFTPKASKCSVQIVAIPRGEIDYAYARESTGGQAADGQAAITFDSTVRESSKLDHDPSGGAGTTDIRALGLGAWVLAFAMDYARPIGGARSANRLNHLIHLRREAASLEYGGAIAFNRGTNGCDRGGSSAHAILRLLPNEDLQVNQFNQSNQSDSNVDHSGPLNAGEIGPCALQAIVLRPLGQFPNAVQIGVTPPPVARTVQVKPSAVAVSVVAPATVRTLQLVPQPVQVGVVSPAVARRVDLTPGPTPIGVIAPAVARLVTLTPTPVAVPLIIPNVARLLTATPAPVEVPVVIPAVSIPGRQTPTPVEVELVEPPVARRVDLTPDPVEVELVEPPVQRSVDIPVTPVEIGVVEPPVARRVDLTPAPVEVGVVEPPTARRVDVTPSPVEVGVTPPPVTRLVVLTPAGTAIGVVAPVVARLVTLTPVPVEIEVLVPSPLLGTIVLIELSLELARSAAMPSALAKTPHLAAALERAVAGQAELARFLSVGAELPTGPSLDALLQEAAELEVEASGEVEAAAAIDPVEVLRLSVNRSASAYALLRAVATVEAEFARVLARIVRIE